METEEGNIEEAIKKERVKVDKEIAPDLKELKKEQVKLKTEIKEKKEEIKVEAIVEPSKFAGKTEEEKLKIYKDMESGYTKLSQRAKELEDKVKELEFVNQKIEEIEKNAVISKNIPSKLPDFPPIQLSYDDPDKYHQLEKEYFDTRLKAATDPLYGQTYSYEKKKVIDELKERTKNNAIPYSEIENEVESRLKKNPELFDQHKLKAREVVYSEIVAEKLPEKIEDIKKKAVEESKKKELEEESEEMSNTQIMSSDITTQKRESKPIDFAEQLDNGVDPQKIKEAIKKKYNIRNEF
jgi:hypothetical protein